MDHELRERFQRHWLGISTTTHRGSLEAWLAEFVQDRAEARVERAKARGAENEAAWADLEWVASALIEGVNRRLAHLASQEPGAATGVGRSTPSATEGPRAGPGLGDPRPKRRGDDDCESDVDAAGDGSRSRRDNDRGKSAAQSPPPRYPRGTLLGRHLAEFRKGMGLTFRQAEDQLGVPAGTLCKAEKRPDHKVNARIAQALRPHLP